MSKVALSSLLIVALMSGASLTPATARDYRGLYWYDKYFGRSDPRPYHPHDRRDGLSPWTLRARAYDQGFYGAQHFHHAARDPEVYALARETWFDREVAIVIDAHDGHVLHWVVLPY